MPDVIPSRDGDAATWMRHFADSIGERPSDFHLSEADAAEIREAVNGFEAAYERTWSPCTRTSVNIALKNEARREAERVCRKFASQIRKNPAISNIDRLSVGLRPVEFREPRLDLQRVGGVPQNRCVMKAANE